MNKIAEKYLPDMVKSREFWDKKSGKIKVHLINDTLNNLREIFFMDEVMAPMMKRLVKKCIDWNIFKKEDFQEIDIGMEIEFKVLWPIDDCLQDYLGNEVQRMTERIWYCTEEWAWNDFSEQELLAMQSWNPWQEQMSFL